MRGYIRERKDRPRYYELVVYAGRDPATGRSRYVSKGFNGRGYRTIKEARTAAEAEMAALVTEVTAGKHAATEGTLGFLLGEWMRKKVERELQETTVKGYAAIVRRVMGDPIAATQLRNVTWKLVNDFLHDLHRSPQTAHNYHSVFHAALDWAVASDWLPSNPLDKGRAPKLNAEPISKVPTPEQIRTLVRVAEGSRNPALATFIRVAAASGARRGELCALRWSSFDPKAGTLLIEQSVAHGRTRLITKGTKTHAARRVNIGPATVAALEEHRARMEENHGRRLPPAAYVFSNALDGSAPMSPNGVTQAFGRFCAQAGIEDVRLHDLRHHFATSLLARGVDVGTVADLLGHRNAAVTLNVYRHFVPAAGERAAAVLDDVLGSDEEDQ